jgi:hypothetical protein
MLSFLRSYWYSDVTGDSGNFEVLPPFFNNRKSLSNSGCEGGGIKVLQNVILPHNYPLEDGI